MSNTDMQHRSFGPLSKSLPISLGVSNPSAPEIPFWSVVPNKSHAKHIYTSVLQRDFNCCQFCGFESAKYQEVLAFQGKDWQLDTMATACIFCAQCITMERVNTMRSGTLIYLPNMHQIELHRLLRSIYVCRISQGDKAEKSRAALAKLMDLQIGAVRLFGSDMPSVLAKRFFECRSSSAYTDLQKLLVDIRLCPLDRRIVSESGLEFNQFPQILAFWRSKAGPKEIVMPQKMDITAIEDFLEEKPILP
ncbi:MAG: hypothetical protein K6L80_11760 [Agarilytica sp.]